MPIGRVREKVLYGIGKARGSVHRYTWWRWGIGILFTLVVALIPLAGILRFDLWDGRHVLLGERVDFLAVAEAFAFPFLAINVVIVLASRFLGRYLCGFVCPVGSLARLGEWLRWWERKRASVLLGHLSILGVCLLLAFVTFAFWVDPAVFVEGSSTAVALSIAGIVVMTLGLYGIVALLGLRFCHSWCPSGVYFAVLGPTTSNGIRFAHPESCTDCKACEQVCPMDLGPREIEDDPRGGAGFYPDGMTNHALCIRCGDCVAACEGTTARSGNPTPLALGWLPGEGGDGGAGAPGDRGAGATTGAAGERGSP